MTKKLSDALVGRTEAETSKIGLISKRRVTCTVWNRFPSFCNNRVSRGKGREQVSRWIPLDRQRVSKAPALLVCRREEQPRTQHFPPDSVKVCRES